MFIPTLSRALHLLTIFLLFNFTLLCPNSIAQQESVDTSTDSLKTYLAKANTLWEKGESDLQLAVSLLSQVSKQQVQQYYGPATDFYYWSLKKATFQEEQEIIRAELERIKPLAPDSTQDKWTELFENKDKQLLNELAGFWEINDPYVTTKVNERLIEHWKRISYAKENFTKVRQPPYSTDERGLYYVRLGAPQKITRKTIHLNHVIGPDGAILNFELGNIIRSDIEIWEYPEFGDDFFLLFGEQNGWGEFGLRKDILKLFPQDVRVQFDRSGFRSDHIMRKFSSNVIQYGIYRELAPYHPLFQNAFSNMQTNLNAYNLGYFSTINKWLYASSNSKLLVNSRISENIFGAPPFDTNTILDNGVLTTQAEAYRFLSPEKNNQLIVVIKPDPDAKYTESLESLVLSNNLSIYDKSWNLKAIIDDPKRVNKKILSTPSTYLIDVDLTDSKAYYSSELIDTTLNNTYIPGKINPKASAIVATSKRQKLHVPHLLNKEDTLLISDVVLGLDQPVNDKTRIPITPSVEHIYKPDTNLMVYFEAYNIPEEGYSFEYYFERHRWLFKNKRPEEKPSVTIINDELNDDRNSQLFSISLSDLEEGTYDLIFKFRPLSQNKQKMPLRTRKIKLVVDDNPRTS